MATPTKVTTGSTIVINDLNQLIDLVEGAASLTEAWKLVCTTGENFIIKLSDAAGARKFSIQDSAGVEVAYINSDGDAVFNGSFTPSGTLILPASTVPATTTDAAIQWDSDDNRIMVGDGSTIQTFYPGQPARRVGVNTTEGTTTALTDTDLVVVTLTESVPASTPMMVYINYRKSSGAANTTALGLKVNATQVWTSTGTALAATSGTDRAEDGAVLVYIPSRETNYTMGGWSQYSSQVSSSGAAAVAHTVVAARDAGWPTAAVTTITVTGVTANAAITCAVKHVEVFAFGA